MIKFENVSKNYENIIAVDGINLEIRKGEFFVIIGPSGCGKTTMLKLINRLIPLSDGTIFINDKKISEYNINELRWNIGYVLQQIALFPHMSIEENVSVVPELKSWDEERIDKRIDELLIGVNLNPDKYRKRKPHELSGGEQQRVGVMRALAADPEILLMDEPFSALDPISRKSLQNDMKAIQEKIKKTIVFVTHDMQEALALGDRICVVDKGKIVQCDTPNEIIANPKNDFVRDFFKSGNVGNSNWIKHDSSLRDLLKEDILEFSLSQSGNSDFFKIEDTISIKELIKILSKEQGVAVNHVGKLIGTIERKDIFKYISRQLDEGGVL